MEPLESHGVDRWSDWEQAVDALEADLGDVLPPAPPQEEPGEPRRSPRAAWPSRPEPHVPWGPLLAAMATFVAIVGLQLLAMSLGPSLGTGAGYLLSLALTAAFAVPLIAGRIWAGRLRHQA